MTISEAAFMDVVEAFLTDECGAENVIRKPHLDESGRIPDFMVTTPLCTWTVEVGNDIDDVASDVGQALMYARHRNEYQAAVFLPVPVSDFVELNLAREECRVFTLDPYPDEE